MVYGFAVQATQGDELSYEDLEKSIRRNFSGLDDLDPVAIFSRQFPILEMSVKVIKYQIKIFSGKFLISGIFFFKYPSHKCLPMDLMEESLGRTDKEG